MNLISFKTTRITILFCSLLAIIAAACRNEIEQTPPVPINLEASANRSFRIIINDHPGRILASNCFQCHGTNGTGLEHLAGKSANEIVSELREMSAKNPRAEIMNVHAQAYTADEIKLIGDFFSKQ